MSTFLKTLIILDFTLSAMVELAIIILFNKKTQIASVF